MRKVRVFSPLLLIRIRHRATLDYLHARGTSHLQQINHAFVNLQKRINYLQEQLSQLEKEFFFLEREEKEKLKKTLLKQIVFERLHEVPGIGSVLAREIIDKCFDGTLNSLRKAYLHVHGIGEKRQQGINVWVANLEMRLPALLKQDFPHKKEIIEEYEAKKLQMLQVRQSLEKELSDLSELQQVVLEETRWLRTVSVEHFVQAYMGNDKTQELVHRYLLGVFPEWKEPPAWFKRLLDFS